MNPNVRIIAYNAESKVIGNRKTKWNTNSTDYPRGGTSLVLPSVVQLTPGVGRKLFVVKEDDGIHLKNFSFLLRKRAGIEPRKCHQQRLCKRDQ
jgi:hypothetical protein